MKLGQLLLGAICVCVFVSELAVCVLSFEGISYLIVSKTDKI